MITVTFYRDKGARCLLLKVSGHAGAAEEGKDIICASASILAYTVAQEAKNMERRLQLEEPPYIRKDKGDFVTMIHPKNDATYADALRTFYVAEVGFELLAYNYPQYVELKHGDKA